MVNEYDAEHRLITGASEPGKFVAVGSTRNIDFIIVLQSEERPDGRSYSTLWLTIRTFDQSVFVNNF